MAKSRSQTQEGKRGKEAMQQGAVPLIPVGEQETSTSELRDAKAGPRSSPTRRASVAASDGTSSLQSGQMTSGESDAPTATPAASVEDSSPDHTPHTRRPPLLGEGELSQTLQWYVPPRRKYSRRELLADRIVNFTGAILSWVAAPALGYATWAAGDPPMKQLGFWAHGIGMVIMLTCSALYHHWSWDWTKAQHLYSLDHVGINSMIMGSYTPLMQYCGCNNVLNFVLVLGVIGWITEAWRLFYGGENKGGSGSWGVVDIIHLVRYLVMGWACLPISPLMARTLPAASLALTAAGGILYTVGIFFFVKGDLEFHLPIWHSKVLLASGCFYFSSILVLVGP